MNDDLICVYRYMIGFTPRSLKEQINLFKNDVGDNLRWFDWFQFIAKYYEVY